MARYDIVFILKVLIKANINTHKYKLDIIFRDNSILSLTITANYVKGKYKVRLVDSLYIL